MEKGKCALQCFKTKNCALKGLLWTVVCGLAGMFLCIWKMLKKLWYLKKRHDYFLLDCGLWELPENFTNSVDLARAFIFFNKM